MFVLRREEEAGTPAPITVHPYAVLSGDVANAIQVVIATKHSGGECGLNEERDSTSFLSFTDLEGQIIHTHASTLIYCNFNHIVCADPQKTCCLRNGIMAIGAHKSHEIRCGPHT